jgi:biopolymer transport protein ExbD
MYVSSPIPHKKARIEIIPLIDIMFFLLASFMMVSLSQVHMKGIKVNLPTGVSGETQAKRDYISLSVDRDGRYYFDKQEVAYDDMLPRLQKVHQTDPEAKVFVRGDRDTVHGNVIRLLDLLRSAGFYKIAFEIKSEAAKGFPAPGAANGR